MRSSVVVGAGGGPGRSDSVHFAELRRLLRLANDLRDLPRGSPAQRRHALAELSAMVGAQVGVWVELRPAPSGALELRDPVDTGWTDERQRGVFARYYESQPRT